MKLKNSLTFLLFIIFYTFHQCQTLSDENFDKLTEYYFYGKYENCDEQLKEYRNYLIDELLSDDENCSIYNYLLDEYERSDGFTIPPTEPQAFKISTSSQIVDNQIKTLLSKSAKIIQKVRDPFFDKIFISKILSKCHQNYQSTQEQQATDKRAPKKINTSYFHSWGGKRSVKPTVNIRTPFHAWGGKRNGNNNYWR